MEPKRKEAALEPFRTLLLKCLFQIIICLFDFSYMNCLGKTLKFTSNKGHKLKINQLRGLARVSRLKRIKQLV